MLCGPRLISHVTEGVGSRFQVLRSRTRFRRYGGRRVPFSCLACPDSFSAVPSVSGPIFKFCAPEHVFSDTEGVHSHFHVLRSQICSLRCLLRQVSFSYFVSPISFSAVPRTSGSVFTFCAPGIIFAVLRASGPVFIFCACGHVFDGTEGVGSRFHVLRSWSRF
jgi:hypothetical protein